MRRVFFSLVFYGIYLFLLKKLFVVVLRDGITGVPYETGEFLAVYGMFAVIGLIAILFVAIPYHPGGSVSMEGRRPKVSHWQNDHTGESGTIER